MPHPAGITFTTTDGMLQTDVAAAKQPGEDTPRLSAIRYAPARPISWFPNLSTVTFFLPDHPELSDAQDTESKPAKRAVLARVVFRDAPFRFAQHPGTGVIAYAPDYAAEALLHTAQFPTPITPGQFARTACHSPRCIHSTVLGWIDTVLRDAFTEEEPTHSPEEIDILFRVVFLMLNRLGEDPSMVRLQRALVNRNPMSVNGYPHALRNTPSGRPVTTPVARAATPTERCLAALVRATGLSLGAYLRTTSDGLPTAKRPRERLCRVQDFLHEDQDLSSHERRAFETATRAFLDGPVGQRALKLLGEEGEIIRRAREAHGMPSSAPARL